MIASLGTRPFEARASSGISASGMRFKNERLIAPITALKANSSANCQGPGSPARQAADTRKVTKLHEFCVAASIERYFPRKEAGTRIVIQGSQAQLEMPRDRLKQNRSAKIRTSR